MTKIGFYLKEGRILKKFKMGHKWLMILRGIPEIYFGKELAVKKIKDLMMPK
jgi:hypothetical protein